MVFEQKEKKKHGSAEPIPSLMNWDFQRSEGSKCTLSKKRKYAKESHFRGLEELIKNCSLGEAAAFLSAFQVPDSFWYPIPFSAALNIFFL